MALTIKGNTVKISVYIVYLNLAPVWPKFLFVILLMMNGTTIGYLVYNFVHDGHEVVVLQKILFVTGAMFYIVAILLIFSHLHFFGCCVRESKNEMIQLVTDMEELDGEHDNKYTARCYDLLTSYKQIRESVSLGLFVIFTLITIVSTFFIFISITNFEKDDLINSVCNIVWCSVCLLILIYLGLAADEADQARINLVDNLW